MQTILLRELSKGSLNSGSSGAMPTALESLFHGPTSLWWRIFSYHQRAELSTAPPLSSWGTAGHHGTSPEFLCSGLNKSRDLSCSSHDFHSRPFPLFAALLWTPSNSFVLFISWHSKLLTAGEAVLVQNPHSSDSGRPDARQHILCKNRWLHWNWRQKNPTSYCHLSC